MAQDCSVGSFLQEIPEITPLSNSSCNYGRTQKLLHTNSSHTLSNMQIHENGINI